MSPPKAITVSPSVPQANARSAFNFTTSPFDRASAKSRSGAGIEVRLVSFGENELIFETVPLDTDFLAGSSAVFIDYHFEGWAPCGWAATISTTQVLLTLTCQSTSAYGRDEQVRRQKSRRQSIPFQRSPSQTSLPPVRPHHRHRTTSHPYSC